VSASGRINRRPPGAGAGPAEGAHPAHFNAINKKTLLAAQKDPKKYRNLIVRIASYSDSFVDPSAIRPAEIIAGTNSRLKDST
jgi:pyruvate-formate lyase